MEPLEAAHALVPALAILAVFLAFAVLMYLRRIPALLAVPLMAVAMAAVAGVRPGTIATLVTAGAASLAPVYAAVIFGALLGRVTLDTGIARALVNLAAEYGGENPLVLALVLCVVVALLFVSLSGLGAIIMVGSIVLPIMMTTGVPRKIAATLFLMAFALGFIFNIQNWVFYTKFFDVTEHELLRYAIALAIVDAIALVAYAVVSMRDARGYATWAARAQSEQLRVGWWALVTPVLPILLYFVFGLDAIPAFAISAVYGVLATRPREAVKVLTAAAIRGVEDVAPAIVLFVGIGMLLTMTKAPQFAHALAPLVAAGWARNPIAFVVIFGLLSPLTLYRGPLNPFGVGIAIFTVLLASHALPPIVLVAAIMAVVQVQNVCDPTNTANVWVANFTGTPIVEITKRTLPYQVAVATLACIAIVTAGAALLGVRGFTSLAAPAYADTIAPSAVAPAVTAAPVPSAPPGLFVPSGAANHVLVGDDGSALARAGADAIAQAFDAGGTLHARRGDADPASSDCSRRTYAAYAQVRVTTFSLIEGTDLDVGVTLEDCGGWGVGEWHDHQIFPAALTTSDARVLAMQGFDRLHIWALAHPEMAANLWRYGLAFAAGDPPTYYFALVKTPDGYMRAFVRGGGPAYAAGMRTGDIVDKIDGLFWWEYGTFQSQERAYDGEPHTYEVRRDRETLDIELDTPFVPS